jgi:hypothetical protein
MIKVDNQIKQLSRQMHALEIFFEIPTMEIAWIFAGNNREIQFSYTIISIFIPWIWYRNSMDILWI